MIPYFGMGDRAAAADAGLEWHQAEGCRWAPLSVPASGRTGFTLLPPSATDVHFTNHLAEATAALNRIPENGSGVALGDVDGDGRCDLYFCRLEGDNVLYRNLGDWKFEEITSAAGVVCPDQYSTGAVLADIDGDGDLDLLVNSLGGGTRSFRNDGRARFTEITDTRLVRKTGSTSMALADIDADGDLDLYVANYRTTTYNDRPPGLKPEATRVDGKIIVTPEDRFIPLLPRAGGVEVMELGERDFLYVNDGTGRFAPVSWTAGSFLDEEGQPLKQPPQDWGLSVMFRDLNGDGTPDLYVCNDFFYFPDRIWLNENSRRFRALPRLAMRHISVSSMGMDIADINRDGHDDWYVTDMVSRNHTWRLRQRPNMMRGILEQPIEDLAARPEIAHNTLFLNRGDTTYAEIAQLSGVDFSEWSWGTVFADVDLDGYEDLLIPTGNKHDSQDADAIRARSLFRQVDTLETRIENLRRFPVLATPVLAFRNRHDLTFQETGAEWGFTEPGPWQGLALADLDSDGDLDVVVNRLNGSAGLFRNDSASPRLAVRLKGNPPNTRGITAKIRVLGGPVNQSQEMICGGRYVSGDDTIRVFAAFTPTNRFRLEVTWRSGWQSVIEQALGNRIYEIAEAGATGAPGPQSGSRSAAVAAMFTDVSHLLNHTNLHETSDDFLRHPTLSRKLSALGPGVAWFDVDGDDWDDLILGGGRSSDVAVFRNDRNGGFAVWKPANANSPSLRRTTSVLGWCGGEKARSLLMGLGDYTGAVPDLSAVCRWDLTGGDVVGLAPNLPTCPGPLALADLDGDGDLDLFSGGRLVPGQYPAPASSCVFRNDGKTWIVDADNNPRFQGLGLVSGAVFSDLDNDGLPELVLACEWGPIRVFRNRQGRLTSWDVPLTWGSPEARLPGLPRQSSRLSQLTGWWNGVTTGDFDEDGRQDLIASNWGRNTRFQRFLAHPIRVYFGNLAGHGRVDTIETYYEPTMDKWVPWRDYRDMLEAFPFLAETTPTFRAYGETGIEEQFGERLKQASILEAITLDSMVFLNRGDKFEARPLPIDAQFAPAFGIAVADLDGDGAEDAFLSQNFFAVEPDTTRYDSGLGLWLKGDGRGGFTAVSAEDGGLRVFGQQRGCAVSDYDRDGRIDLVVTQHGSATKLYRNERARPGLRVRLKGPGGNPLGIGAVLRAASAGQPGPAREVHAGSGYWSQDSAVTVLSSRTQPGQVKVRWPGGKETMANIPPQAKEIELSVDGSVKTLR